MTKAVVITLTPVEEIGGEMTDCRGKQQTLEADDLSRGPA